MSMTAIRHGPTPIFPVADMSSAQSFYQRLGFRVNLFDSGYAVVADDSGEILHLRAVIEVMPEANLSSAYLNVIDADDLHDKWTETGISMTKVEDRPWGMREFSLEDPSGNTLRVGMNL